MATYADLKARIIAELARDDLAAGAESAALLAIHIADACDEFASRRFWFNQVRIAVQTVVGEDSITIPAGLRIVSRAVGPYGDLTPLRLTDAPNGNAPCPQSFTYLNGELVIAPTPTEIFTLTLYGIAQIDAPTLDGDSNAWTNEAARLISAQTRMTLCRDVFEHSEGEQRAGRAVMLALEALTRETDKRLDVRLAMKLSQPNGRPVRMAI